MNLLKFGPQGILRARLVYYSKLQRYKDIVGAGLDLDMLILSENRKSSDEYWK